MTLVKVAIVLVGLELRLTLLTVNLGLDLLIGFVPGDAHVV